MLTDLDFFEQEIQKFRENISESLANKRIQSEKMKANPMDELQEVYIEVQNIETDFRKTIDITDHLMKHYRDVFL